MGSRPSSMKSGQKRVTRTNKRQNGFTERHGDDVEQVIPNTNSELITEMNAGVTGNGRIECTEGLEKQVKSINGELILGQTYQRQQNEEQVESVTNVEGVLKEANDDVLKIDNCENKKYRQDSKVLLNECNSHNEKESKKTSTEDATNIEHDRKTIEKLDKPYDHKEDSTTNDKMKSKPTESDTVLPDQEILKSKPEDKEIIAQEQNKKSTDSALDNNVDKGFGSSTNSKVCDRKRETHSEICPFPDNILDRENRSTKVSCTEGTNDDTDSNKGEHSSDNKGKDDESKESSRENSVEADYVNLEKEPDSNLVVVTDDTVNSEESKDVDHQLDKTGTPDNDCVGKNGVGKDTIEQKITSDEALTQNNSIEVNAKENKDTSKADNEDSKDKTSQETTGDRTSDPLEDSTGSPEKGIYIKEAVKPEKKTSLYDLVQRDNDKKLRANLDFYDNKIRSRPAPGYYIDEMLRWHGDYCKLERNHQYIQWLFPMYDSSGMNSSAQPLQKHEADAIQNTTQLTKRVLKAFKMMLNFYGMKLVSLRPPKFSRDEKNWKERYDHLNSSSHNHLRITRIMRSIGFLGYQQLQYPWLKFILEEAHARDTLLPKLQGGCIRYWIESLEDADEQEAAVELLSYFDINPNRRKDTNEDKTVEINNYNELNVTQSDLKEENTFPGPVHGPNERKNQGNGPNENYTDKANDVLRQTTNGGASKMKNFTIGEGGGIILDNNNKQKITLSKKKHNIDSL